MELDELAADLFAKMHRPETVNAHPETVKDMVQKAYLNAQAFLDERANRKPKEEPSKPIVAGGRTK
jgi:hypothetical protein